mmetsp:Transcript_12537/g.17515  ORF Transcript_12537/g.17515 Transcript_12537/m.17515 type:complete len:262 (-) Transcript_12537:185-970(-)
MTTPTQSNSTKVGSSNTDKFLRFNVGGQKFEVSKLLIEQNKDTMLARMVSETWKNKDDDEMKIDRNGEHFPHILNYLRYGQVHLPQTISKENFLLDLDYYGIQANRETVKYECYAAQAMELNKQISFLVHAYAGQMGELVDTQNTHTEQIAAHTQRIEDHLAAQMRHNIRITDLLEAQNDHHQRIEELMFAQNRNIGDLIDDQKRESRSEDQMKILNQKFEKLLDKLDEHNKHMKNIANEGSLTRFKERETVLLKDFYAHK